MSLTQQPSTSLQAAADGQSKDKRATSPTLPLAVNVFILGLFPRMEVWSNCENYRHVTSTTANRLITNL